MGYGGYHPYPRRFGGGKPRLQVIHESLNAQRGTALDTSNTDSVVWIEDMALARAINGAWATNERLSHQWDPLRVTDMLPRWEGIMRLVVSPGDTDAARRVALNKQWARFGQLINIGQMSGQLQALLGDVFVAIEFISLANAVIHVPDGTYPFGTSNDDAPWYSTVMHMLIRTQVPDGYTEQEYLNIVGPVFPLLDGIMPAFVTWTVYRPGPVSTPVTGGPSAGGFYLDDPHNLNWEVFDV